MKMSLHEDFFLKANHIWEVIYLTQEKQMGQELKKEKAEETH